ncbi:hypothetical protein [Simkania sp.]|uniref:hypothetical protein n=1 Tax=Simkania sp. TaxID=34094 RepID=UPI003B52E245
MSHSWDQVRSHVGGIAGFLALHRKIKQAGQDQGSALKTLDPFQSTINERVKEKVEEIFDESLKPQSWYAAAKKRLTNTLCPTSQAVIDRAAFVEEKASQAEHTIHKLTSLPRAIPYIGIGTMVLAGGFTLSFVTLNPVKLFLVAGIFFSIINNHSAMTTLLQDFQRVAKLGQNLLRQPLEARIAIKRWGKNVVDAAYQDPSSLKDPHAFHLTSVTQMGIEKAFGTREEFETTVDEFIQNKACRPIRNFEKKQRFELISRISDAIIKKVCVIASTQLVRITITNLTGLGFVALLYWGTHYHLDTALDHCEWWTPLTYTWNRVFPVSYIHQFPEMCHRYLYLTYISDITKWALRFYIWNRMIKAWEASRETAVDDLIRPVKDWSVNTWSKLSKAFQNKTQDISKAVFGIFQSIEARLSGTSQKEPEVALAKKHIQCCWKTARNELS